MTTAREMWTTLAEKLSGHSVESQEDILMAFQLFDLDKRGKISFANLKRVAHNESLGDNELMEMIMEADEDRDGEVSFDEFKNVIRKQ